MFRILPLVFLFALSSISQAADNFLGKTPAHADSREAIMKDVAETAGLGQMNMAHFDRSEREILVLWHCPFSGRDSCCLFAYYRNAKGPGWTKFVDEMIDHSHDLSAALYCGKDALVIFDVHDKEIRRYDVSKFIRERPEEKPKR